MPRRQKPLPPTLRYRVFSAVAAGNSTPEAVAAALKIPRAKAVNTIQRLRSAGALTGKGQYAVVPGAIVTPRPAKGQNRLVVTKDEACTLERCWPSVRVGQ